MCEIWLDFVGVGGFEYWVMGFQELGSALLGFGILGSGISGFSRFLGLRR